MSTRRSRSQWQQLMTAQQASGLSQKAFCQQEGISVATFGYWKRKLKGEEGVSIPSGPQADSPHDWLELPLPISERSGGWQIELDLGNGVCLRLSQG